MLFFTRFLVLFVLLCATTSTSTLTCQAEAAFNNDATDNDYYDVVCPVHCRRAASSLRKRAQQETTTTTTAGAGAAAAAGAGARIFYLIILHNEESLKDALHLFRAIRDPRNIIAIHVDVKARHLLSSSSLLWRNNNSTTTTNDNGEDSSSSFAPSFQLLREIESCPCGSTIKIEAVHDVQWSQWSMNLPTLWGLQVAVKEFWNQWDVFINLAGNTLPVYTTDTMARILADLPYNFVTSSSCETGLLPTNVYWFPQFWHKRRHYTRDDTEPDPTFVYTVNNTDATQEKQNEITTTVQIHFGSQWVILQADFCHYVVTEMERSDSLASQLADYLRSSQKKMTDETFLPTLLLYAQGEQFRSTLPQTNDDDVLLWRNGTPSGIRDVRYERMDEHVPTAFGHLWEQQRYDVPESSVGVVDKPRAWGPYYLGVYDLANIRASGALFVRKISQTVDPNMIRLLPVEKAEDIPNIQWPTEVSLTPKPDWERIIREAREKSQRLSEQNQELDDDEEL